MQSEVGVRAPGASRASRSRGATEVESGAAPREIDRRAFWPQRIWWTVVGCLLINWSIQLLSAATSYSWVALPVVVLGAWGLATVVASWLPDGIALPGRLSSALPWLTALLTVATFVVWAYVQVRSAPGYGTDELAFDQYAAQLTHHGLNPYLHSMAPAFPLFRVSPDGYTYSVTGAPVTQLSYPALSFLLYVPLLALGFTSQLAVMVNVAAWALTVLLIFGLLPKGVRPAALVIGSIAVYVSYAVGGVTDVIYMPLLVLAAYRWNEFGRSRISYLGPVMLGLAMAVKQTPWPLLPFILCALALEEHARAGGAAALRRCARYLALTGGAFLLPNIWYLAVSPGKWISGIFTPIVHPLVPAGQGAIALSLFLHIGGGSLVAFTIAMIALGLALLVVYVGTYPLLRPATFILPALVLFFASRSYGSYLVSLVPAALVGAVTLRGSVGSSQPALTVPLLRSRVWAAAILATTVIFAAALAFALTSGQPLRLHVGGIRTTGQLATIEQLNVSATNTTSMQVSPSFTVDEGGAITTFWHVVKGPRTLAPGATATYTIVAPNMPAQPSISGGFTVLAFSRGPAAVSSTSPYEPSAMHVALTPEAVNGIMPIGRSIVIHAQLLDQLDRRVRRANVPVYLGQIIYDQSGLELGEATINSAAPGQTPVRAYTNADGTATFTLVGTQAASDPIYFEANLVQSSEFYPYGYSEILPIRFGER